MTRGVHRGEDKIAKKSSTAARGQRGGSSGRSWSWCHVVSAMIYPVRAAAAATGNAGHQRLTALLLIQVVIAVLHLAAQVARGALPAYPAPAQVGHLDTGRLQRFEQAVVARHLQTLATARQLDGEGLARLGCGEADTAQRWDLKSDGMTLPQ